MTDEQKRLEEYLLGYARNLKNANERAYTVERCHQMAMRTPRPIGMSADYEVAKNRVPALEGVLWKVYKAALLKFATA